MSFNENISNLGKTPKIDYNFNIQNNVKGTISYQLHQQFLRQFTGLEGTPQLKSNSKGIENRINKNTIDIFQN